MTNLRRLMVVVVAIAMVVTSMATAFGAPLSDISGKKYEDAVNKLQAFGIVAGIDGQYKGEDKLTRKEFATFIVNMMGLGKQAQVDTIFSDATAKDWFSGYVNAVNEAGYMVGADGKFSPDKNVTYGEAITVLMKMLGYAPVVDNRGTWPSNYVNRANNIKITDGVSVSASAAVTRGNLAILLWNTLVEPKLVEGDEYDADGKPTYKVAADDGKNTILYANFNEAAEKEATVFEAPINAASYANNEIKLEDEQGVKTGALKVPAGTDPNTLLGMEVKYVADKDDNIKWIGVTTDKEDVIVDTVKTFKSAADGVFDSITFTKVNKAYLVDNTNLKIFYNGVNVTGASAADKEKLFKLWAEETEYDFGLQDTAYVKAILNSDDKKVKYLFVTQDTKRDTLADYLYDGSNKTNFQFGLVTEVGATIKGKGIDNIDRKDYLEKADLGIGKNIVYKNDKVAKLTDIKVGDLLRYAKFNGGIVAYAYTPTIETVKVDTLEDVINTKIVKVVAGDKKFNLGGYVWYSVNKGEDKYALTDSNINELAKFIGYEGTKLYVAASGKVAYIENAVADSDVLYGVLVKREDGKNAAGKDTDKLTIFTPDGSSVSYVAKDDITDTTLNTLYDKLVAYKLSTKNEITTIDTATNIKTISSPTASGVKKDDNYVLYNGGQAAITNSTVFVNLVKEHSGTSSQTAAEVELTDWDTVKNDTSLTSVDAGLAKVAVEDGVAKIVFLYEAAFGAASRYGVVVGTGYDDGETTIKINYEGVVSEYVASSAYMTYAVKGMLVNYSISGDDITSINKASVVNVYDAATQKVLYHRPGTGDYTNANGVYNDSLVVGKVISVDKANRIISFKGVKNHKAETNDPEIAISVPKDMSIYVTKDVSNIIYTEDLATLEEGNVFVYDNVNDILLIVKTNSNEDLSQVSNSATFTNP